MRGSSPSALRQLPIRQNSSGASSPSEPIGKEAIPISDIIYLLEHLERLLSQSWRIPMSNYVVANEDDLLDVVDQMRTAIPKEIKHAERLLQERDRKLAQAEEEASRIVHLAQADAEKLAEDHEIVSAAHQRANTIIERSQREAQALKLEADEYVRSVLLDLNEQLDALDGQITGVLATVHNGLKTLTERQFPDPDSST
jgi:vacuolar-type H+-ATPase subunit H